MSKTTKKELEKSLQFAWIEQKQQQTIIELTIKNKEKWENTKLKQIKETVKQSPNG